VAASVPAPLIHAEVRRLGVMHVLIVPDRHQRTLIASLSADPGLRVLTLATEDEPGAVGVVGTAFERSRRERGAVAIIVSAPTS
jgi:hypothetical protein